MEQRKLLHRQLSKAERNYSTIEREALAIVKAVREFYPYLSGHEFVLQTDHQPLVHLNNLRDVGGRIARWSMFLQQFSFTVKHKADRLNGNADGLSRMPLSTTVAPQLAAAITEATVEPSNNFVIIREAQAKDVYMASVLEAVRQGKPPPGLTHQHGKIFIHKGVLCRSYRESVDSEPRIQMLILIDLRSTILEQLHDSAGHMGVRRTMEKYDIDITGLGMNLMLSDGYENVNNVKRGTILNHFLRLHWVPLVLFTLLRKSRGTLWAPYLSQKEVISIFW